MASESTLRLAAFLAILALLALAPAPAAAGPKKYFLTPDVYPTSEALAACGKGFHMASLFELLDPTQLSYDTKRGHLSADSGSGPPAGVLGWIRTGGSPSVATTPGLANCDGLTSTLTLEYGTVVQLDTDWSDAGLGIGPWVAQVTSCFGSKPVCCKQN